MRILIVEDDPLVALALKMFLAELGDTVVGTAADTIGAVRVLEDGVNADWPSWTFISPGARVASRPPSRSAVFPA